MKRENEREDQRVGYEERQLKRRKGKRKERGS